MKDLATKAFTSLKSGFVKAVLGALESFGLRFFRHFLELQFKEKQKNMEKATSWSYTEKRNYKFFPPSHGPVQDSASSWKILIQPPVRVVEQHLLQVGKIGSFRGKVKMDENGVL